MQPAPSFRTREHQPVQGGLKRRGLCGSLGGVEPAGFQFPPRERGRGGDSQVRYRVVKFLAVGALDGLDGKVKAAIRAPRNFGAITAAVTFKQKRAAHAGHFPRCDGFLQSGDF